MKGPVAVVFLGLATAASTAVLASEPHRANKPAQDVSLASVRCGTSEMSIRPSGLRFNRTSLHLRRSNGTTVDLPRPGEMADYTAVGLGCARTGDGEPYFIVQYGELPWSCKFCEWFYLHDTSGAQLTRSNPPVLFDAGDPNPSAQHLPNHREFNALSRKLEIDVKAVEIVFAECRPDPDDIELCLAEAAHE